MKLLTLIPEVTVGIPLYLSGLTPLLLFKRACCWQFEINKLLIRSICYTVWRHDSGRSISIFFHCLLDFQRHTAARNTILNGIWLPHVLAVSKLFLVQRRGLVVMVLANAGFTGLMNICWPNLRTQKVESINTRNILKPIRYFLQLLNVSKDMG